MYSASAWKLWGFFDPNFKNYSQGRWQPNRMEVQVDENTGTQVPHKVCIGKMPVTSLPAIRCQLLCRVA